MSASASRFEASGLVVDLERFEARLEGRRVRLERRPFDLLVLLAREEGRVVSRDRIASTLWGEGVFVDAEQGINTAIRKVRLALRDDPDDPRFIETVVGRGYRFVPDVTWIEPAPVASASPQTPIEASAGADDADGLRRSQPAAPVDAEPPRRLTRLWAGAGVLAVLALVAITARPGLRDAVSSTTAQAPTTGPAREAYLKGRAAWARRTERDLHAARGYFEEAIGLDPTHAEAYAGLADALTALGYFSYESPRDTFLRAKALADRALQLDATLAEALATRAYARLYYDWDAAGAEADFRAAIQRDPTYATAHHWFSVFLASQQRFAEAAAELARARELDPQSMAVLTDQGWQAYLQRDYARAATLLESTVALSPEFPLAHLWLGRTYEQQRRFDAALREFEKTVEALPTSVVALVQLGHAQAAAGHHEDARRTLAQLKDRARVQYVTPYGLALIEAALDDRTAAFASLRQAIADRSHWLVWLALDPRWDPLRSDDRFQEIVRLVGLQPTRPEPATH